MKSAATLALPGRFDSLPAIQDFVTRAALAAQLDERAVYAVQLALDEAFSNIIAHAYGRETDELIECAYRISESGLTLVLRDHGRPFDPATVPDPDLDQGLEDRNTGGLGVYFVRQLMDRVHFQSDSKAGNTLTLVKYRESGR